jgi:hypothetical protein
MAYPHRLVQSTPPPRWLMAYPPEKAKARGGPQVDPQPRVDQKVSCLSNAQNAPPGWRRSSDRWHQNNPKPPDVRWLCAHQVGAESPSPSLMRRGTRRCRPPRD